MRNVPAQAHYSKRIVVDLARTLVVFWLLSGCQTDSSRQCEPKLAAVLPLTSSDGHFTTPAVLNGTKTTLLFDTGAWMTELTEAAAERLSLKVRPTGFANGIGGSHAEYVFATRQFELGNLRAGRLELLASDIHVSSPKNTVDGLLGSNFLAAYNLDLDFFEHKARLFQLAHNCVSPVAVLDGELYGVKLLPVGFDDPRPMVKVQIGGTTLNALIDTGAPHSALFRDSARELGLKLADLRTDPHFHIHGTGPRSPEAVRHVLVPIEIGDLTISHLPVAIVDQRSFDAVQMILGLDFLTRVHVWLSFSSRTMIMQFPPRPSPIIAADRL